MTARLNALAGCALLVAALALACGLWIEPESIVSAAGNQPPAIPLADIGDDGGGQPTQSETSE